METGLASSAQPERSSQQRATAAVAEWIDVLSSDRYRPMLRLLQEDDCRFLSEQPGFTPSMLIGLRLQRRRLLRAYLRRLDADFKHICTVLEIVRSQSPEDRPGLAWLLRNRVMFACSLMLVRLRLWLHEQGVGSVDVTGLVTRFDAMRLKLHTPAADSTPPDHAVGRSST